MCLCVCVCRCGLIVVLTTQDHWLSCLWLDIYLVWEIGKYNTRHTHTHTHTVSPLSRHPSNLMLDRLTGRILHIDFGDCFEVAMTREKFPEKIPFRLTRMLTNAMEVSIPHSLLPPSLFPSFPPSLLSPHTIQVTGIEGNFRRTCMSVMSVLRENKDSVMAVLEAFVYDPLLNWRLMDGQWSLTMDTVVMDTCCHGYVLSR